MDASLTGNPEGGMTPQGGDGASILGTQAPTTPDLWTAQLKDDALKTHPSLTRYKDIDSLAKSHVELDKLRNERTGVKPLTAESTPEDIAAYRTAMGVPEKPDGYELSDLKYPQEYTPTQEQMAKFKAVFHQAHLTPAQVRLIMEAHAMDISEQAMDVRMRRIERNKATMDQYYQRDGAQALLMHKAGELYAEKRFGKEGLEKLQFGTDGLGPDPIIIELLMENAKLTGNDKAVMQDARGGLMDATTAKQKIDELWGQRAKATNDNEKEAINREIARLSPIAYQ